MDHKFNVTAQGTEFPVTVPEALVARAVRYALGVVAQRETAGMAEETPEARIQAIKARLAKIAAGDWSESGGRSADPVTREVVRMLRTAPIRTKAGTAYKVDDVPGASDPAKVVAFLSGHFNKDQVSKINAKAKKIVAAAEGDTL